MILLIVNIYKIYIFLNISIIMMHEKYKIVSQYIYSPADVLGTGTWGTVYKGKLKNSQDNKQYAIKKMNKFKI